ncbi:MAG: hypothetical protein EA340_03335 [Nitriliruptor sp.]|nr:MAG: hypothetical protein EA340_03335 [Nitriliruptor sp.]
MITTDTAAPAETTEVLRGAALGGRSQEPAQAASARMRGTLARQPATGRSARATVLRRRLVALAGLVLLLTLLTVAVGRVGAEAELADRVAGHTVLAPGDTLWDVAVSSAPEGVDPREQLSAIRVLNGFEGAAVDAWTVVLLPAR